jgi:cation-transporting ATPase 13A3/4/5
MLPIDSGKEDVFSPAAILYTMTTCHSLKLVSDEIIGDPLDTKMFEFTGWTFEEGGHIYEFVRDQDDKETENAGLLDEGEPPKGKYVTRDGSQRSEMPVVRPPASEGTVF